MGDIPFTFQRLQSRIAETAKLQQKEIDRRIYFSLDKWQLVCEFTVTL